MTRVQARKSGRILTTIPKGQASTLDLDGQYLSWHVESRSRLRARPEGGRRPEHQASTRVRYNDESGSYTVDIPASLARAMHLVGANLDWVLDSGDLYASVTSRGDTDDE